MISERTLRQWRKDALTKISSPPEVEALHYVYSAAEQMQERILRLTQELMDLHLVKKG